MNNISLLLLCKCVNVRLQYLMRVHEADNTDIATTKFDQKVEKVVESWVGPLTVDQKKIISLPLRKGGFGLTACNPNRANAYAASRFSVLERLSSSSARTGTDMTATHNCIPKKTNLKIAPVDNETSSAIQHEKVWKELQLDPEIKPILQATSFKGNNDWLTSHVRYIPSHLFRRLCRSGPDFVIYWNNGEVFYDLTVVHELSVTNRSKKCSQLINDAINRKLKSYVHTNLIREESF